MYVHVVDSHLSDWIDFSDITMQVVSNPSVGAYIYSPHPLHSPCFLSPPRYCVVCHRKNSPLIWTTACHYSHFIALLVIVKALNLIYKLNSTIGTYV